MRFNQCLTFNIVNRITTNEVLYKEKNSLYLKYVEQNINKEKVVNKYYAIEISFTTFTTNESAFLDNYFLDADYKITDARVRCNIHSIVFNENDNSYSKAKYSKTANKTFKFSTDLLNYISKLQSFIYNKIIGTRFESEEIEIDFSEIGDYVIVENSSKYSIDQIRNVINTIEDLNDINVTKAILNKKALLSFKDELESKLSCSEQEISKVFKKHENLLPLILLGYDATLTFEARNKSLNDGIIIPDIKLEDSENNIVTLVELKKATEDLFGSIYRTDTLKIKTNFSNAIHQTNIQRTSLSSDSKKYSNNISSSILIIGNLKNESKNDPDLFNLMQTNLNVLRYNNKDLIIMTYDQLLDRVTLLINKL